MTLAAPPELLTQRLRLRRWTDADRAPFAALNADPVVMEHLPALLTPTQSDEFVDRIEACFDERRLGLWVVEVAQHRGALGYVGLWPATFAAPFTPAIEVGWRLRRLAWGRGFATEAARAAIQDGFERLDLDEVVSFTSTINARSRAVMGRLGMTRNRTDDFEHPSVPVGDSLRPHVLYRLARR
jgi:RimJ/RimL family protein N-acetyltransferase